MVTNSTHPRFLPEAEKPHPPRDVLSPVERIVVEEEECGHPDSLQSSRQSLDSQNGRDNPTALRVFLGLERRRRIVRKTAYVVNWNLSCTAVLGEIMLR
jgi:hypothetical protein